MQRAIRLWFFASLALAVSMFVKEAALPGKGASFHWSYDVVLSIAALSLFVASIYIYRYGRLLACSGLLCCVVMFVYYGLPTF